MRGERTPKKSDFWSTFFLKWKKKHFLACFFEILPAVQKIWPKQGLFIALGELEKSNWSTYRKSRQFFAKFVFENQPPVNPSSAPVIMGKNWNWIENISDQFFPTLRSFFGICFWCPNIRINRRSYHLWRFIITNRSKPTNPVDPNTKQRLAQNKRRTIELHFYSEIQLWQEWKQNCSFRRQLHSFCSVHLFTIVTLTNWTDLHLKWLPPKHHPDWSLWRIQTSVSVSVSEQNPDSDLKSNLIKSSQMRHSCKCRTL